jgi:hypothetical protein
VWLFSILAAVLGWRNKANRRSWAFAAILFVVSFIGASFGLMFRQHYFILVLPAVGMLAGAGSTVITKKRGSRSRAIAWPVVAFSFAFVWAIVAQRDFLFAMTPEEATRATYGLNPFVEAQSIGQYITAHTEPSDRIAVLGSEAEILFYSRRMSATGYIFTYGLMQPHPIARQMQREMSSEIEAGQPEYLVFVNVPTSWAGSKGSDPWIFDWFNSYSKNFEQVGLVELGKNGRALWNEAARAATPAADYYLAVLKRKH